jgi:hypothetical protein
MIVNGMAAASSRQVEQDIRDFTRKAGKQNVVARNIELVAISRKEQSSKMKVENEKRPFAKALPA